MGELTKFQKSVYVATAQIPKGRVSTYAEIARAIKNPKSARAVGNALNRNPYMPDMPCHRVVKSTGELGGFADGPLAKIKMLQKEGVRIKSGKIIDFPKKFYMFK